MTQVVLYFMVCESIAFVNTMWSMILLHDFRRISHS